MTIHSDINLLCDEMAALRRQPASPRMLMSFATLLYHCCKSTLFGERSDRLHPPAGGVRIQQGDFSVDEEIAKIKAVSKRIGGIVSFVGSARDFSKGRDILKIEFSHFPKMAEAALAKIREEAMQKFEILEVTLIHRFGSIAIGDNIVLIVVGAMHRKDAFAACAWCIDRLKETAPIWKKETTPDGAEWVEDRP